MQYTAISMAKTLFNTLLIVFFVKKDFILNLGEHNLCVLARSTMLRPIHRVLTFYILAFQGQNGKKTYTPCTETLVLIHIKHECRKASKLH